MRAHTWLGLVALGLAACKASAGRDDTGVAATVSVSVSNAASGTGGLGGAGGDVTTSSVGGSGGASSASSAEASVASSAASTGSGMLVCPQGAIVCEGNVSKVCDGKGGFLASTNCGGAVCSPNLGCSTCQPGKAQCVDGSSLVCSNDGKTFKDTYCDPLQGLSCDPMTGLCAGACTTENLGQSYYGCDYFPTVTNNQLVSKSSDFAVAVSNTTTFSVTATITQGPTTVKTATLAPSSVQVITLPWVSALDQQTTQLVVDGAYRLRTTRPVTVYQYNPLQYVKNGQFTYTNDASLLLPVNAWTGNYRVVSRNHWVFAGFINYGGLYAVTASQNGTMVTVTPSPTGGKVLPGAGIGSNGAGTVTLDEGDVLQVFTNTGGGNPDVSDLTGTLISASKPVQVIGGHLCTNVPYSVTACDHLEESMPPLETLAKEYIVTAPLINPASTKVRMVRVVATADATTLSYDPAQPGAPTQLNVAGSYVEIPLTAADFAIQASKPVMVAEYFTGQQQGGGAGDPAMTLAVATAQYRTSYLFHAPTNYESNFVNVVAPTKASVMLDNAPVSNFTPIGTTGY
ncbi:MAG: IgGFc-binding protein, partial [Deltaproteobacteria bacterium]|nr:IgGFc-binding protein [Deltaproteobacteria bacterium]